MILSGKDILEVDVFLKCPPSRQGKKKAGHDKQFYLVKSLTELQSSEGGIGGGVTVF